MFGFLTGGHLCRSNGIGNFANYFSLGSMSKIAASCYVGGIAYPERPAPRLHSLDHLADKVIGPFARRLVGRIPQPETFLSLVSQWDQPYRTLSEQGLQDEALLLKSQLVREGYADAIVARSFALIREVAHRTLGQRHFDVQLLGGWALLRGLVAEMDTDRKSVV